MASTTALFTGLSGLNANSRYIDVTGNNISNVNTTAFKGSRVSFETQFSRTLSMGREPDGDFGGTNPYQVGLGTRVAGTLRDQSVGTIQPTGDNRDLAIDGDGFFIVERQGQRFYTRDGAFRPNENNVLTTVGGELLRGYGVDAEFNIQEGQLQDISIPVGQLTIAEATSTVRVVGNLDADGVLPTNGSRHVLGGTATTGFATIGGATVPPLPGEVLSATGLLTEIEDPALPGSGTPLYAAGQVIEVTGVERGDGSLLPDQQLTVTATTTVQQLMDFLSNAMELRPAAGANPDGATPGVSLDTTTGQFIVTGHTGTANSLDIEQRDIRLLNGDGSFARLPMTSERTAEATGESVRTSYVVYDSLGSPVSVDLTFVLDGRDSTGTTWRYFAESPDDTDPATGPATGTVRFDTFGRLIDTDPIPVSIDRVSTGALTPLAFDLELTSDAEAMTALSDVDSQIGATFRDGAPIGTLNDFGVGPDGVITGVFSNGLTRTLGLIPVAKFTNPAGLLEQGGNLFTIGPNAGNEVLARPGTLGAGQMVGGGLELSNVDLGQEFINLIQASTGYSASSRVIQTTDELIQQLLVLGR
ncbi:MAG: flagellar hook-basal body complex protein [Planctomycetota bacterium]